MDSGIIRMHARRWIIMAYRRKVALVIIIVSLMVLVNRILLSTWDEITVPPEKLSEAEKLKKAEKEKNLENIKRISANFAPFQNKYMPNIHHTFSVEEQDMDYLEHDEMNKTETNIVITKTTIKHEFDAIDSYKYYLSDFGTSDLQHPFVNLHKYEYILNNKIACNGDVFVVIMVNSAPDKVKERMMIRNTWGSVRFQSGTTVVTLFLLAKVAGNDKLQEQIAEESKTYLDIVQGNFFDAYRNLTCKTVMGLHWIQNFCNHTKFVVKVDDDTMVDVYHLVNFLLQKSPDGNTNNFLYGSVYRNQGPVRRTNDKWFVSTHEYPYSKYPPYCEGFAYIMSNDVTKKLYYNSRKVKYYWIDDVYITGLVALKAGISPHDMESGHAYNLMQTEHLSKHVQTSIFLLAKYENLRPNWNNAWNDIKSVHNIL